MPVLVVCATLLDQRSIFSLLEDVSQADETKLLSPSPSGSAVPPCIYTRHTSHCIKLFNEERETHMVRELS